jgi:hypothetical protein
LQKNFFHQNEGLRIGCGVDLPIYLTSHSDPNSASASDRFQPLRKRASRPR